jgi:hypothetical protein
MLPLHYLADDTNRHRLDDAERLRPGRQEAARRRAARLVRWAPRQAVQAVRKAFQLRA